MPHQSEKRLSLRSRLHLGLRCVASMSALLCSAWLSGCQAHTASAGGSTASFLIHSNAPQWKILNIELNSTPDEVKQLIQKQWPQALISYANDVLVVSGSTRIPDAPRIVVRPEPGAAGLREQLVIQFNFKNEIVLIAHGKTFPLDAAPLTDEFLHAFSKQYAPGVDNGYDNRTYYSGPDGVIHQALPGVGGIAAFSYAGSRASAAFPNAAVGEIDLSPQPIAIDPVDKRHDHVAVKIEGWSFQGVMPDKLYGYAAELESETAWDSWVTERQARKKAAASYVGDSLKGTQF